MQLQSWYRGAEVLQSCTGAQVPLRWDEVHRSADDAQAQVHQVQGAEVQTRCRVAEIQTCRAQVQRCLLVGA